MAGIVLKKIDVTNNRLKYLFSADDSLKAFFDFEKSFTIEYYENGKELDFSDVPHAVLAIPFVCNVLPIIWLEDAELHLSELDEDFYHSIPEFKKGYINMFPDVNFKGKIHVDRIVDCSITREGKTSAFFSGGLDAMTTLLRHLDEKPDLISIWGADIGFDNRDGWMSVNKAIEEIAAEFRLNHITIHSSFRQFDREGELERKYYQYLHDGWWHGVKHGIGLIGQAAPYAWLQNICKVYIASSFSPDAGKIICASDPTIDNYVRFCGAEVIHDGYELSRQDKVAFVTDYHRRNPKKNLHLHVCWESTDGNNCCHCEKCYRTMVAIWIESEDPKNYGFNVNTGVLKKIYKKMALEYEFTGITPVYWNNIKQKLILRSKFLKNEIYYKDLKWIETFDFFHPEKNRCRRWYRLSHLKGVREILAKSELYQKLRTAEHLLKK